MSLTKSLSQSGSPAYLALEPRMMFDGAALVDAQDAAAADHDDTAAADGTADADTSTDAATVPPAVLVRPPEPALNDGRREVAFIDASLTDRAALLNSIAPGVEVRLIGGGDEGLAQIAAWAADHSDYDAVHILSSGASGALRLGTDVIKAGTLESADTQASLTALGNALTGSGDLLLYGCDVASGPAGAQFLDRIAELTGADVAASTDTTGAASHGGDWVLEARIGSIEAATISAPQWSGFLDAVSLLHNGVTTSYATIQDAVDASQSGDTVSVGAGTYIEQVTITRDITLVGAGRDSTIIRAPLKADMAQSGGDWRNLKNNDVYAIVGIKSTTGGTVTVRDLTVDGFDQGYLYNLPDPRMLDANNWSFSGISAINTNLVVDNVKITRVRELASDFTDPDTNLPYAVPPGYEPTEQPSGMNHNEAIFAESADGAGQHTLLVTNSYIDKFQKTGILAWGPTLVVDINNNVIQGYGGTLWNTGNAIQIASSNRAGWGEANGDRRGTSGSVTNNQILDLGLVIPEPGQPGSYLNLGQGGPAGILLWEAADGFAISGNTVTGVFTPSWHYSGMSNDGGYGNTGITVVMSNGVVIANNTVQGFDTGIVDEWANAGAFTTFSGNTLSDNVMDIRGAQGDDVIVLSDSAERVGFVDGIAGADTVRGFGTGDRLFIFADRPGMVNGLIAGVPVVNFTGTISEGDGTSVAAGSVQVGVSGGNTVLYIDTDGVAGAAEMEIHLEGVYSTANFALSGGDIVYVNTAPTLTGGATHSLGTTTENNTTAGTLVSAIAGGTGHNDFGAAIQQSIAITAATGNGTWQYSTNGTTWVNIGTVSSSAALLLRSTDRIRYVPDSANGETPTLSFRAWDETSGTAHTKVSVASNGGTTAFSAQTASASLAVTDVNDAPTTTPIGNRTFGGSGTWTFQVPAGAFVDVDGDTMTFSATLASGAALPSWLSFNAATRTFSGNPPLGAGPLDIRVTANDGNGGTAQNTFRAAFTGTNDTPTAGVIGGQAFGGPGTWSFQVPAGTFADADGDTLTYSATLASGAALPSWLSFDAATRTFSGNPPYGVGTLDLRVTADDGKGGTNTSTFRAAFTATNDTPTAGVIGGQAFGGPGTWSFQVPAGAFTDADGDALTYSATLANGAALPSWLSFDAATRTFSGNPPPGVGAMDLRVTVGDGKGGTATTVFRTAFTGTNDAPVAGTAAMPHAVWGSGENSTTLPATIFADADAGDSLTLSASGMPSWMSFDPDTGTLSGQPPVGKNGVARVTITATDGGGATVRRTIIITYEGQQHPAPPVAPAPPPQAPPAPTGQGSGEQSPVLLPTLTQADGTPTSPPGVDGAPQGNADATPPGPPPAAAPPAPQDGPTGFVPALGTAEGPTTSIVEVAPTTSGDALVLARPMDAASLVSGRSTTFRMAAGTFTHSSADAVVTIEARQADGASLPEWITFDPANGTFTVTPPEGMRTEITVRVIARDQNGNEAETDFTVTVGETAGDGEQPAPAPGTGPDAAPEGAPAPANQQDGHLPDAPPVGRPGLSSQLAAAGQPGLVAEALAFIEDLLALADQDAKDQADHHNRAA